jgi:hypothetical protein
MKVYYKIIISFLVLFFVIQNYSEAQYMSTKVKGKYKHYIDSLKKHEYKYIFPIGGQEAYRKGFDIPYPAGIMVNYIYMDQGLYFHNLQLGLLTDNVDIPLTPVDFIQFEKVKNKSYSYNIRPDVWILPFLNIYGIFGYGRSKTEVNVSIPEVANFNSIVDQGITTSGVGVLLAGGLGPVWISGDFNWTWNKPELVDEAVRVNVMGIRIGHTFVFANSRPDRNIAVWVGGMRVNMAAQTVGTVKLIDALPPDVWNRRDEIVDNYHQWYNSLDPNNPGDKIKQEVANRILTPIVDRLEAADGESAVRYGIEKEPINKWNMLVGFQFQYNKRWMLRSEAGIIGDRKSILVSLNYRFPI